MSRFLQFIKTRPLDPKKNWGFFRYFLIGTEEEPYIERFIFLRSPFLNVKVHRIHRPDEDRDLHNHPWWFLAFILKGGYIEEFSTREYLECGFHPDERLVNTFNFKREGVDYHRIDTVASDTWSLIVAGPRADDAEGDGRWGFWTEQGHVPWREYLGDVSDT